ncbi:MAG TPA: amino acid adenylation domain-containing protein, partial [Bacteroidia bacterium]|nr:amino acid adenylation domain-containing protein [Bacteroidia bacterium]
MVSDLYVKLKKLNVNVQLVDGKLDLHAPKGILTSELVEEIKYYKEDLIHFINSYRKKNDQQGIDKAISQPTYPLSSSQRRLWILSQFEDANIAYNTPGIYVFEGHLNVDSLEFAFNKLIERHEILRTVFVENEQGEIRQLIKDPEDTGFKIGYTDLRKAEKNKLQMLVQETCRKPFDLKEGPMLSSNLYQVEDNKWIFCYVIHHIISDAWSMTILINELLQLYNIHFKQEQTSLPPLRIQYKDYACWQQEQLNEENAKNHKEYWLQQFDGELSVLDLPGDKMRPAIQTYNGGKVNKTINSQLTQQLKLLINQQDSTLFMGMLAVVNILLYRYTNQEDMVIGTPIAGRDHADLEDQIGFYVNTLALRLKCNGEKSYPELLASVKQIVMGAYEHQIYPFDQLVEGLELKRDMSRNPLFDVQVIVGQNAVKSSKQKLGDLTVSVYEGESTQVSRFDLVFDFTETGDDLLANIEYNSDIYTAATIERFADHLEQLITSIVQQPALPIGKLNYLKPEEKKQLIETFNDATFPFPANKTLIDLFNEQVKKTPDLTAVVFDGITISYKELNDKSNQLACYLLEQHKINADDLVGIMLERSDKMIIAILGVLKSGAAYVPIDPTYPKARQEFIATDTGIKIILTQTEYIFDIDYYTGEIFAMDVQLDSLQTALKTPSVTIKPEQLAYVIYTSGSTGQSKGVMIEHRAIVNTVFSQKKIFDFKEGDKGLQFASPSFDASVWELFFVITSGGTLCIVDEETKKNSTLLEDYLEQTKIDFVTLPPAYLRLMNMEKLKTVKQLVTAGEAASPENAIAFSNYGIYYNAYGPTETSICASVFKLEKEQNREMVNVPIGKPLPNTQLYIVDKNNELLPIGMTGEICIGGAGLARGYLKRELLTKEKFIENPFGKGNRIYKTGDLGRWLADGNIEFIGRKDEQVKVHGYRIELGEIENALKEHAAIDAAIVITKVNKQQEKEMIAYILSRETLTTSELRAHLSKTLPVYMLPGHFILLTEFPLTPNGKIDKKKLPDPIGSDTATGNEYIEPRNNAENKLVKIWQQVLGRDKIGIRDKFFDLGGDSIKLLRMLSELRKELELQIQAADVYKYNTIEELLTYASENKNEIDQRNSDVNEKEKVIRESFDKLKERILTSSSLAEKENVEDIYPMSDIEKGMVYESIINEGLSVYHDQIVYSRKFADFEIERFRLALELIVDKHSILRTCFHLNEHETEVQIVYREIPVSVPYENISHFIKEEQEKVLHQFTKSERENPFNVSSTPLWRMNVFYIGCRGRRASACRARARSRSP